MKKQLRIAMLPIMLIGSQGAMAGNDPAIKTLKQEYKLLYKTLRRDYDEKRQGLGQAASDALERDYWDERLRLKRQFKSDKRMLETDPSYSYRLPEVKALATEEIHIEVSHEFAEASTYEDEPINEVILPKPSEGTPRYVEATAVIKAQDQLGRAYVYGDVGRRGFDCSGLVQYAYSHEGIELPRTSSEQAKVGKKVKLDEVLPGDLLFFSHKGKKVTHVGIVSKVDGKNIEMIHASTSAGVIRTDFSNSSYWRPRFRTARRVKKNRS